MKFGEKIKKQRSMMGLSQKDAAKSIGVTSRTLINYESGNSYPQNRTVYFKLADFFGVDVNYFLTEDEEFLTEAAEKHSKNGIARANSILEQVEKLFAGNELSESDQLVFLNNMLALYLKSAGVEWKKFTPNRSKIKT